MIGVDRVGYFCPHKAIRPYLDLNPRHHDLSEDTHTIEVRWDRDLLSPNIASIIKTFLILS